ncbi:hypothetical protein PVAP13_3KG471701 [Panicum virgatum]|uniref:Uncharacterized protein n=1 Tax=Panicum virgatum TaxID=38727 RepID=A0A8T0V0I4_PANVG|nr:hypothetical protein PVAP13_3KG471701 [Panicum virgatum]
MGNRKNILQLHDCNNRQPKFMYYLHKSLAPPREINQIQLKSDRKRTQGTLRWRGESDLIHTSSIRRADCWAGAWGCFYHTSRAAGPKWAAVPDPPECYTIEEAPVERKVGRWVSSAH